MNKFKYSNRITDKLIFNYPAPVLKEATGLMIVCVNQQLNIVKMNQNKEIIVVRYPKKYYFYKTWMGKYLWMKSQNRILTVRR